VAILASAPAAPAVGGAGNGLATFIPLILIFLFIYFIMLRPQNKAQKERSAMLSDVRENDEVITIGGIHGTVVSVEEDDDFVIVEVAADVRLKFQRIAIHDISSRDWREEYPQFQKKGMFSRK
jgi:preprotein translocase subunit YajC